MLRPRFSSQNRRNDTSSSCSWKFTYASLRIATENFSGDKLICVRGSARIYRGILDNGMSVAINKYDDLQPQQQEQFLHTIKVMSQIRHRYIMQVIGYCMKNDRFLLVTEYAENGSVSDLLQDAERRKSVFDWQTRASICIGISRGLSYLHEDANPSVVHGSISSSNVLLDANFTPKIRYLDRVEFSCDSNELQISGSLDSPQYTEKVDVYGFGVVMLEIISGKKFINESFVDDEPVCCTAHWASTLVKNGRLLQIVDPLLTDFPSNDVERFIYVGLLCTLRRRDLRPSMPEVVLMLHGSCHSSRLPNLRNLYDHSSAGTGCQSSCSQNLIDDIPCRNTRMFSYASLQIATDNFSTGRLIGKGGSARIYKGVLANGTVVAVKKYSKPESPQYQHEFAHIVVIMSQIQHQNINQVIGCCIDNDHRLLVMEYAENGSLWDRLQQPERKNLLFSWQRRAAICHGVAQGLTFLHEDANPRVVHRDIKSSNILLDSNFTPKIADFETVDYFHDSHELPRNSEELVIGTLGYLDPQYSITSQYTEKVDVYSFGVVMLEIISGRSAINWEVDNDDDRLITRWASNLKKCGRVEEIVDPTLIDFPTDVVQHFIDVALSCTQLKRSLRPSMFNVGLMLHGGFNSFKISPRHIMPLEDDGSNFPEGYSIGMLEPYTEEYVGETSNQATTNSCTEVQETGEHVEDKAYLHDMIMPLIMSDIFKSDGVRASATQEQRDNVCTGSTEQQSRMAADSETYIHRSIQQLKQKKKIKPDNIAQRLSQTVLIKRTCEEAVYPPFITRAYPRLGPKHLFTS